MNTNSKITKHHIIAKEFGGTNHFCNIEKKRQLEHRSHHNLFGNDLPHEQISTIVDLTGQAFRTCFADDILSVVNDYDIEEIYNKKCIDMNKYIRAILDNK